ncbi:MAG: substrate-binding domain-containing protein [Treponema sp.]|nr:substrate-binding domain-containing protein [Treponema sp.]
MKKILSLALVMVLFGSMLAFAGGAKQATGPKQLSFTFVLPMVPNEIWVVAKDGFEDACNKYGVKPVVVMPSSPNDINQMNNLMETAIIQKTDGLLTQAVNPEGMMPAFRKLDDAKIPYALVSSDAPDSKRIVKVGTGGELGRIAAEYIVQKMGNQEIRYITALWALEAGLAIDIHTNYQNAFAKAPGGSKELTVLETRSDQLYITNGYQNAFATYPDANACVNVCGFGGAGAARAATEAGIGPERLFIMAIDDIQETMDGIRSGRIQATMTQNFYRMGYEATEHLYNYVTNGTRPPKDNIDSSTMVVDMTNITTYMQDMRNPAAWK